MKVEITLNDLQAAMNVIQRVLDAANEDRGIDYVDIRYLSHGLRDAMERFEAVETEAIKASDENE